MTTTKKNTLVRLYPETRDKLDEIAAMHCWDLGIVVDQLATRYLKSKGKTVTPVVPRRRRIPA